MTLLFSALLLACTAAGLAGGVRAQTSCTRMWVTGYVATGNPTADGTNTAGRAWQLAAAHPVYPFGALAEVEGVGVVRVADRGYLRPGDLDILVGSVAEARALTGEYAVCWR